MCDTLFFVEISIFEEARIFGAKRLGGGPLARLACSPVYLSLRWRLASHGMPYGNHDSRTRYYTPAGSLLSLWCLLVCVFGHIFLSFDGIYLSNLHSPWPAVGQGPYSSSKARFVSLQSPSCAW